jgi:ATP-binding cassette, subfamily B, bacterial
MKKNSFSLVTDMLKLAYALDKASIFLTAVLSLVRAVKPYIGILLSAYVIDGLSSGAKLETLILTALAGVAAIFLLSLVEGALNKHYDVHVEICAHKFNMELSKKTLTMDFEQLDSPLVNDIRNRIKTGNNWGAGFYSVFWQLSWLLNSLFGVIASAVVLAPLLHSGGVFSNWAASASLAALILIMLIAAFLNAKVFDKRTFKLMDESAKYRSYFYHFLFGGIDYKAGKDFRIYDASQMLKKYCFADEDFRIKWMGKFSANAGIQGGISGFANGILQGGAYLFVVLRAIAGEISLGSVVKYAATIFNFADNLTNLMAAYSQLAVTAERQQANLEYIRVPDVLYKGTLPVEKRSDNEYELEFCDVSFKYPGSENYSLQNINLKLSIGQRLAVVGMNGSGKTTMIKLLCRLYDPTEGVITLNGIDIRKYDYGEYMSVFGVVFQDFKLFSFPLGQNVAASVSFNTDKATACLDKAGFGGRLASLPMSLDTPLYKNYDEGGVEISGGEAQKIALARALYKDAPFVVLDEPTAALDPIAEFEVYSKFDEIVGTKTAIYISHRLSSCRFCDDIAVFHEGRIIQRGSHDELLKDSQGKYSELWRAQAQYYNVSEQAQYL